jgi:hypothetical protein
MTELEVLDLTGLCEVVAGIVLGVWAYSAGKRELFSGKKERKGMVAIFFGYYDGEAYDKALSIFLVLVMVAYRRDIVDFLMPVLDFITHHQWIGALVSGLIGGVVGFGSGEILMYIFAGMVVGFLVFLLLQCVNFLNILNFQELIKIWKQ